jgi:hypothetical protein
VANFTDLASVNPLPAVIGASGDASSNATPATALAAADAVAPVLLGLGSASTSAPAVTELRAVNGSPRVLNRCFDAVAGAIVTWATEAADPAGALYPGPGSYGVQTTGHAFELIAREV